MGRQWGFTSGFRTICSKPRRFASRQQGHESRSGSPGAWDRVLLFKGWIWCVMMFERDIYILIDIVYPVVHNLRWRLPTFRSVATRKTSIYYHLWVIFPLKLPFSSGLCRDEQDMEARLAAFEKRSWAVAETTVTRYRYRWSVSWPVVLKFSELPQKWTNLEGKHATVYRWFGFGSSELD